jgi:hypothetical protein
MDDLDGAQQSGPECEHGVTLGPLDRHLAARCGAMRSMYCDACRDALRQEAEKDLSDVLIAGPHPIDELERFLES